MWQSLGDLIPESLKKAGITNQISDAMLCEEFNQIAKDMLGEASELCRAVYIKDRVLWVAVLSNAVSNELRMSEHDIVKALADKFGPGRITGLRFMS